MVEWEDVDYKDSIYGYMNEHIQKSPKGGCRGYFVLKDTNFTNLATHINTFINETIATIVADLEEPAPEE